MKSEKKQTNFDMKYKKIIYGLLASIVLVFVMGLINMLLEADGVKVTKQYNDAVTEYNALVDEFNLLLQNASIDNVDGIGYYEKLSTVSEEKKDIKVSLDAGNTPSKIKSDTKTIEEWCELLKESIEIVKLITNPTGDWVKDRLTDIELITDMDVVTEETDVNAMLGKDGGYTSCIYFGVSSIDASEVSGDTIVEKGTDAGGAIEVYATLEDAEARCEYLSEYENTFLYSGSYAIVGTMVIRTSYKLTPQEQLDLTDAIVRAFTDLN